MYKQESRPSYESRLVKMVKQLEELLGKEVKLGKVRSRFYNQINKNYGYKINYSRFEVSFPNAEKCYNWLYKKINILKGIS